MGETTKRLFDRERAERGIREFLLALGEDLTDPNVSGTPERVTRMYCDELLSGHTADPSIKSFPTPGVGNSFVVTTNLAVRSMCSHHLMPVSGVCHIGAYFERQPLADVTDLPGLSKYQRLVDKYARRLQLQERMTKQIADDVVALMAADWVIVYVRATHFCMVHRGVQNADAQTATTSISYHDDNYTEDKRAAYAQLKLEFLQEVALHKG